MRCRLSLLSKGMLPSAVCVCVRGMCVSAPGIYITVSITKSLVLFLCFLFFFFCSCVAICHRQCRRLSKFQMITRTFIHFISDKKKLRSNEKPSMRMVKQSGTPSLSSIVPHATKSKWLVRDTTQIGSRVRCKRQNEEKWERTDYGSRVTVLNNQ